MLLRVELNRVERFAYCSDHSPSRAISRSVIPLTTPTRGPHTASTPRISFLDSVDPKLVATELNISPSTVRSIWAYWILKREACGGKPLVSLVALLPAYHGRLIATM